MKRRNSKNDTQSNKLMSEKSIRNLNFDLHFKLDLHEIYGPALQALAEILKANTTLKTLSLTNLGNINPDVIIIQAVIELLSKETLTSLNLSGIRISDIQAFLKAIEKNKSLIDNNKISSAMGQLIATVLEQNRTLKTLSLNDNLILDDGIQLIMSGLKNNKTLTITYSNVFTYKFF